MQIQNTNANSFSTPLLNETDAPINMEITFHSGDKLPVKLILTGEVFKGSEISHTVEFGKTIFIKMGNNEPLFKFKEKDSWIDFEKLFTGRLGASVSVTDESPEPSGVLELLLNVRK